LQRLFQFDDFKLYFQGKNRVIIILNGNQLFVHGYKFYAEMTHNQLLKYIHWDYICTEDSLNQSEINELISFCEKENISLDQSLSIKTKKLLLNILDNTDGIELVNVTTNRCPDIQFKDIIDLSMDDDEDLQIVDLTEVYERQVIINNKDVMKSSMHFSKISQLI